MTRLRAAGALGVVCVLYALYAMLWTAPVHAQTFSQRGFVDVSGVFFPQEALNDPTRAMGDLIVREEVFVKPAQWVQLAAGRDLPAESPGPREESWRVDFADRGTLRPAIAARRLSATVTHKGFTIDAGKQFIRWGKTDVLTPTDRFAPRDFFNVLSPEFLPVLGVRATMAVKADT